MSGCLHLPCPVQADVLGNGHHRSPRPAKRGSCWFGRAEVLVSGDPHPGTEQPGHSPHSLLATR